jgi:hypothetical protein
MSKKLIRCHTTDPKSIFDCVFNEPIEINPYSEIALQSASFSLANQFLVVDATNDELTFQVQEAGGAKTVRITHGTYTKHNATQLLEAITRNMNKSLALTVSKEHGTEISVLATNDSRVVFDMQYGQQNVISSRASDQAKYFADASLTIGSRGNNINITNNANLKGNGDVDGGFIVGSVPFTKGCGNFIFKLTTYVAGGAGTIYGAMGLVDKDVYDKYKDDPSGLTTDDFKHIFQIPASGQADPDQGKSLTLNSNISMELTEGVLRFREYRADNSEQDLFTIPEASMHDFYDVDLYPVLVINDEKENFKIKHLRYTPTPFVSSPSLITTDFDGIHEFGAAPSPKGPVPTKYNLTFGSITLRDYLGFSQNIQNPLLTKSNGRRFEANRLFANIASADNFLVEMLNMKLDSYDSFTPDNVGGGRKNILAPIPISERIIDAQTGLLQYQPSEMLFISMNNEFKMDIRQLRLRVIDTQYNEVNNAGFASLNIVIRDVK